MISHQRRLVHNPSGHIATAYGVPSTGWFIPFMLNKAAYPILVSNSPHSCRETYGGLFAQPDISKIDPRFVGLLAPKNTSNLAERVACMLDWVSSQLGERTRCIVSRISTVATTDPKAVKSQVDQNHAVCIYTPPWWRHNGLRHGMLTLFVRGSLFLPASGVSLGVEGESCLAALRAYTLAGTALPGILEFLKGSTVPVKPISHSTVVNTLKGLQDPGFIKSVIRPPKTALEKAAAKVRSS